MASEPHPALSRGEAVAAWSTPYGKTSLAEQVIDQSDEISRLREAHRFIWTLRNIAAIRGTRALARTAARICASSAWPCRRRKDAVTQVDPPEESRQ
jgi:hypothetical protein